MTRRGNLNLNIFFPLLPMLMIHSNKRGWDEIETSTLDGGRKINKRQFSCFSIPQNALHDYFNFIRGLIVLVRIWCCVLSDSRWRSLTIMKNSLQRGNEKFWIPIDLSYYFQKLLLFFVIKLIFSHELWNYQKFNICLIVCRNENPVTAGNTSLSLKTTNFPPPKTKTIFILVPKISPVPLNPRFWVNKLDTKIHFMIKY